MLLMITHLLNAAASSYLSVWAKKIARRLHSLRLQQAGKCICSIAQCVSQNFARAKTHVDVGMPCHRHAMASHPYLLYWRNGQHSNLLMRAGASQPIQQV